MTSNHVVNLGTLCLVLLSYSPEMPYASLYIRSAGLSSSLMPLLCDIFNRQEETDPSNQRNSQLEGHV